MDTQLQSILEQELLTTVVMTETLKVSSNLSHTRCSRNVSLSGADQLPANHCCCIEIADGMERDDKHVAAVPRYAALA